MTVKTYRLPMDVDLVPANETGVYWFGLVIPSGHEIGLRNGGSQVGLERATAELTATLDRFAKVYSEGELTGRLRDNRHRHLAMTMDLTASSRRLVRPSQFLQKWLVKKSDGDVSEMLRALRRISDCLPPVYIGLAYEQSLSDRLYDHLDGRSKLLGHLNRTGLRWQDLYYRCVAMESLDKITYRALEKTLQSLYRPVFSNR